MAEGDGVVYNNFKERVMEGAFDLTSDTIKIALVSGYTANIDTHTAWNTTSAPGSLEFAATGNYTEKTLTSLAVTQDDANDRGKFDAADVTWSSLNLSATSASPSHAVMYKDHATATDELICYWEVTTASNGGNYTLQFNTAGILTIS
jgi:hypothetical protein